MARLVRCGLIQTHCEWSPEKYAIKDISKKMLEKTAIRWRLGNAPEATVPSLGTSASQVDLHLRNDAMKCLEPRWRFIAPFLQACLGAKDLTIKERYR